ncbi:YbhB/YbcL family Raf kinase inhibitor-like protein [Amycolatopsis arida]|uniref:YbhB/YbcL family Raf kinase inhibitor-like protein n=1 Tax=Amycolatopsis arida TaxID=587909 RepID=UPI000B804589|nr:YbhB/YbcL family Raf kinase inhibitor-like protein [Amycolatopsis arida]
MGDPDRAAGPTGTRGTSRGDPDIDDPARPRSTPLELRSAAFNDHTLLPERYSRQAGNHSPPLEWRGVPDATAELVLTCTDPDAPNGTFTHWLVTGIPPESTGVGEDEAPPGTLGRNDFGELGWGGPQPPVGDQAHRYFFNLYAVDRPLGLGEGVRAEDVRAALDDDRVLAKGTLVGLFGR